MASPDSKGVQIGLISCYDARQQFYDALQISEKQAPKVNLYQIYLDGFEQKHWVKMKKKEVDALFKEKFQDPAMNAKKWNHRIHGSKRHWRF